VKNGVNILIDRLSMRYRGAETDSLQDVSIYIGAQEKFGIIGPNGAGKTTLISILCGLISQSSGSVKYTRESVELPRKEQKSIIGFVPQEYAFYENLTARQDVQYFGALHGMAKKEIALRMKYLFEVLGLEEKAHRKVKTFSGGMKRRLNLAIGIIQNPKILFLDEPTVGVDAQSKHAIIKFLNELNSEGTTIIYTSHHLAEAEEFCNKIALLDRGKVIAQDSTVNLIQSSKAENLEDAFIQLTGGDYRDSDV